MASKTRTDARAAPAKGKAAQSKPRASSRPKRQPAGRPTKYSATAHRKIVRACKDGNYRSIAFRLAGIHEDTGFEWLKLGRESPAAHPQYAKLGRDILQAEAAFEDEMVRIVAQAARRRKPQSWLPAMTVLERTRPQRFARRDTTVIEGGETPLQVRTRAVISTPELRKLSLDLLRGVAAARPEQPGRAGVGSKPPKSGS